MIVFDKILEYCNYRKKLAGIVGFVPTMGYLHEGHASLVRAARKQCDYVIVSIFVNPTQFGPNEDFSKYPRDFERDRKICEDNGADCIFYPKVDEMYSENALTKVNVEKITKGLCGTSRPTHFCGATTIVTKLFNIIQPDIAYFGQKDIQQCVVIKKMVEDLNIPVVIEICPIVRESDGLAMSSRNIYLNEIERKIAPIIYESLRLAESLFVKGRKDAEEIKQIVKKKLDEKITPEIGGIDYIEIIDRNNLESVAFARENDIIAVAVFIGKTRLIDNLFFSQNEVEPSI